MNADLLWVLKNIKKSYRLFEHNGKPMSKEQVEKVVRYGINKGYKNTNDFTDDEIDNLLSLK